MVDKALVQRIAAEVQTALDEVAARHGLTVKVGGGRYDPEVGTFSPKITFTAADAEAKAFAILAPEFGLKAEDYGRKITVKGRTFKVVGLNPRASRFPLMGEAEDGRQFKLTESVLAQLKS